MRTKPNGERITICVSGLVVLDQTKNETPRYYLDNFYPPILFKMPFNEKIALPFAFYITFAALSQFLKKSNL